MAAEAEGGDAESGTRKVIYAALFANLLIAIAKFIVGAIQYELRVIDPWGNTFEGRLGHRSARCGRSTATERTTP
ncbi:MAG TPA: hypothetical protein VGR22_07715 [Thermomicrobiales bacterium]|nr:hypothetical protein [Thermomicrobiales bacterium]